VAEQSSADYRGTLGRYALFGEIAAGGMATVHLARLIGSVGFARTVAIKRLHPHLAKDPDFVRMFLEEARLAARVHHPNVVATLDVVQEDSELFLVMEYVSGESLSRLMRKAREAGERLAPRYVVGIMCAALEGLHAAHEATSERGVPLGIVHRDVSPQNIHVGIDGVGRVLDFGIAKATNRVQETRTDRIKGKVAYMSPEQLAKGPIDRRADVYSACVVLWEALTGARMFNGDDVPSLVYSIMNDVVPPPSEIAPHLGRAFDPIVMRGLDRDPEKRWPTARELAVALERVLPPAPPRDIGDWVERTAGEALAWRMELVQRIESETSTSIPPGVLRARPARPPSMPVEPASGVREYPPAPPPTESDATTHELPDRSADRSEQSLEPPAPVVDAGVRADEGVGRPVSPAPPAAKEDHRLRLALAAVAVVFVVALAGAVLAFRWMQLENDSAAAEAPAPADSGEEAIAFGVLRKSASAPPPASSAPSPPKAKRR
jgi:serine/threonine-protein kinase